MDSISVIVPIYHGINHISRIINLIERTKKFVENDIELLIINDDPETPIDISTTSDVIDISVFDTSVNRGIHGARVYGLFQAKGDWILFLDQDDIITDDYFKKQLSKVGNADAVVCKSLHDKKEFYNNRRPFEKVVSREYMIGEDNFIVSPGQVLIRKEAIPEIWKQNIMHHNGTDDWFLWICMFGSDKQFAYNDEILFEHVIDGKNTSLHSNKMYVSTREIYEIVASTGFLSSEEEEKLYNAINIKRVARYLDNLDCLRKSNMVYNEWLHLLNTGRNPLEKLESYSGGKAAIYGVSRLGSRVFEALQSMNIQVQYYIDINAPFLEAEIPVYAPDDKLEKVNFIIIALTEAEDEIREMLEKKDLGKVFFIWEMISTYRV